MLVSLIPVAVKNRWTLVHGITGNGKQGSH